MEKILAHDKVLNKVSLKKKQEVFNKVCNFVCNEGRMNFFLQVVAKNIYYKFLYQYTSMNRR